MKADPISGDMEAARLRDELELIKKVLPIYWARQTAECLDAMARDGQLGIPDSRPLRSYADALEASEPPLVIVNVISHNNPEAAE